MEGRSSGEAILVSTDNGPVEAFSPNPLPPDPPLEMDAELQELQVQASLELGRLDGITVNLPDPDRFLYAYARKEAVLSSQIEGTQSSLSDLMLFERGASPETPADDVKEAVNYLTALNFGVESISEGMPISLRLIREMHEILLRGARGGDTGVGEFRKVPNWIGGTNPSNARYVPPPPNLVPDAMSRLEAFLHGKPEPVPILVRAALAHVQFESIHPFLDGNGRLGRLLITMMLSADTADGVKPVLERPLLYLSLYLKSNRDEYYERLQSVRTEGDWEGWVAFFLKGVILVAQSTIETTRRIVSLLDEDRIRVMNLGRASGSANQVFELFARKVVLSAPEAVGMLELTEPTVSKAIRHLETLGILSEVTGRKRNRLYSYSRFLRILSEGTEPL